MFCTGAGGSDAICALGIGEKYELMIEDAIKIKPIKLKLKGGLQILIQKI